MRLFWILLTAICLTASSVCADVDDISKKVREALAKLREEQCSLDLSQEKMNTFCKTVTGKDTKKLLRCFEKDMPCTDFAPDLSSATAYINGKSYTFKADILSLACGIENFSFTPSDGCMTEEDARQLIDTVEKIVEQLFNALANCVDGLVPTICPNAVARRIMKEPLDNIKAALMVSISKYLSHHPCDSQCKDGKDSNGFITQECCTKKGWIFVTKNDNRNYCCPPGKNTTSKCPAKQTPNDQCISSCRIGTQEINGECCPEDQIAQVNGVLECCPSNQSPSSPNDDTKDSICCPYGQKAMSTQKGDCCKSSSIIEENGKKTCCPENKTLSLFGQKTKCCPGDEIVLGGFIGYMMCCPPENIGKSGFDRNDSKLYCCDGDYHATNGHCCDKGYTWFDEPSTS